MVRIADLPDITSTICCRRTYIARNNINYPKNASRYGYRNEKKLSASLENLLFTRTYAKTKAHRLCFPYIDRTIPLLPINKNFKPLSIFCGCTSRLMFELVGNHRVRVSCDVAQISNN